MPNSKRNIALSFSLNVEPSQKYFILSSYLSKSVNTIKEAIYSGGKASIDVSMKNILYKLDLLSYFLL